VRPSLREILADTHIAAVAIAVLLLWTLDGTFRALCGTRFLVSLVSCSRRWRSSIFRTSPRCSVGRTA